MNIFSALILGLAAISCSTSSKNYTDTADTNTIPAYLEERQEEEINLPDTLDKNQTPAEKEKRTHEESRKYEEFLNDERFWE
jgi:hypothetical protein